MGQMSLATISSVPVSVILRTVWNDMGEVFVRLRSQSIIGLSILVVFEIVGSAPSISSNPVLSEAFSLTTAIATLPFEIAIFRLLILGETARGYPFAVSTIRFQRMLGWTVAVWAVGAFPTYVPDGVGIAAIVIGIAILVRGSILLPAIALRLHWIDNSLIR